MLRPPVPSSAQGGLAEALIRPAGVADDSRGLRPTSPAYAYLRKSGETGVPNSTCFKIRPTSRAALIGAGSF
jgi:hypothetical protein